MSLKAKVWPMPLCVREDGSDFLFDGNCTVCLEEGLLGNDTTALFTELWHSYTYGGKLSFGSSQSVIATDKSLEFDYTIKVSENGFCITGKDRAGVIHGFFSLLQLISPVKLGTEKLLKIYGTHIEDKPMVAFRSVHICVFPETTLDFLHRVIRLSAAMKYSHIIIEFWGMLKYDCMKELAWENAYTKEQIRPLIKEANALGLEVIPMFNHFGHATASRLIYGKHVVLDQSPEKALLFEPDGWTWCLSNPDTLALLGQIRDELIELCGPGEYFHFGCDEAYSYATCDICKDKDKLKMLTDYFNSLAKIAKTYNRKAIIWGDMLLDSQRWDDVYYALSWPEHKTHEIIDELDHDLVIADWQYNVEDSNVETAKYFREKGFEVLLCPWDNPKNITALADCAKELKLDGVMATTWQSFHDKIELLLFSAENMWSDLSCLKDADGFKYARKHENYQLMTAKMQRMVYPSDGGCVSSGWTTKQIPIWD